MTNNFNGSWANIYAMLKKDVNENKYDMKGNEALRNFIKKYVVYALDVRDIKSNDIDVEDLKGINKFLKKSKFNIKRKKLRGIAVEDGLSAIAFDIVNGKVFFDVYRVMTPFTEENDTLKEVYLYKDQDTKRLNDEKEYQRYYRYSFNANGFVEKQVFYGAVGGRDKSKLVIAKNENVVFDDKMMPVVILPNNEDYESTFEYADNIIATAGKHLENIDKEWQYDKSMLINNNLFEPERTSEDLQKTFEDGKERVIDQKDPNGQYAPAVSYLSSGGISSQVAQRNYDKFKQEALSYTLSWLVVSDGKTNKHGAEVITSQLPSFNSIQFQKELLEEFYSHFIYILTILLNRTKQIEIEMMELPNIEVSLSPMLDTIINMGNTDGKNNIVEEEK